MKQPHTLPDYIKYDLDIVFIGINPGVRSAEVGHHYAGHSNRFWKLLNEAKLIPCVATYEDDWRLPEWGLGLTNLVSRTTSSSGDLAKSDYAIGQAELAKKIRLYRPRILALLGLTLYPFLFPNPLLTRKSKRGNARIAKMGLLPELFEGAKVVVLPNPSGRNAHYSYHDMLKGFFELKYLRDSLQVSG